MFFDFLRLFLRKFKVWFALDVILFTCLSRLRFDCKVTPRYFVESVSYISEWYCQFGVSPVNYSDSGQT